MKLAVAATVLAAGALVSAPRLLREQAWTSPNASLAHILTHAPHECVDQLSAPAEIGRALFRSPETLGGPAARLGLSCNACHGNGRANANFLLPELTDRAGAADVTSEWASKVRGDGVMNPRLIPDLAGVAARPTHGQHADPSLEHFVHSVIEEEFQGHALPAEGFDDLIVYLRTLDTNLCALGETRITLATAANDVRRTIAAAASANDGSVTSLVLLAGQDAMGRLVERLPEPLFATDRMRLERLARELGDMRNTTNVAAALAAAAPGWRARFDAEITALAPRARCTYFNEATLRRALASPSTP